MFHLLFILLQDFQDEFVYSACTMDYELSLAIWLLLFISLSCKQILKKKCFND